MKNLGFVKGTLIAVAVAGFFGCSKGGETKETTGTPTGDGTEETTATPTGDGTAAPTADLIQCSGVNECSGKGECGAADGSHACAGKNECKGKGWVKVSEADCTAKGGTVMATTP